MRTAAFRLVVTLVLAGLPLAAGRTITVASPEPVQRVSHVLVHRWLLPSDQLITFPDRRLTEKPVSSPHVALLSAWQSQCPGGWL